MAHSRGDDDAGHLPADTDPAALDAAYNLMTLSNASGFRFRRPSGDQSAAPAASPVPAGPARAPFAAVRPGSLPVPANVSVTLILVLLSQKLPAYAASAVCFREYPVAGCWERDVSLGTQPY
jgi:hypothetical protein